MSGENGLLDDFRSSDPRDYIKGFHGIRIAASKPSPTSFKEVSNTRTVWRTKA